MCGGGRCHKPDALASGAAWGQDRAEPSWQSGQRSLVLRKCFPTRTLSAWRARARVALLDLGLGAAEVGALQLWAISGHEGLQTL